MKVFVLAGALLLCAQTGSLSEQGETNIAVWMVVDNQDHKHVIGDVEWEAYYRNFIDMVQNRFKLLGEKIRLLLTRFILLNEEENKAVFKMNQKVWDPNYLMMLLKIFLQKKYPKDWPNADVAVLITQRNLQLPALGKQRTYGDTTLGSMCGALRVVVVEHHGDYVEVNTMVKLLLRSIGVFFDGEMENEGCAASDRYIMGNIPQTYPGNYEFSQCTKTSVRRHIAQQKQTFAACFTARSSAVHAQNVTPFYDFKLEITRDKFCGFIKKGSERCLFTSGTECFVTCCRAHLLLHELRGKSLPLPDSTSCGSKGDQICLNGKCTPPGSISQTRWQTE